jgi:predicted deacylase
MRPEEFDPQRFEPCHKYALDLELAPQVPGVSIPVLLVRGRKHGKVLVVLAGVHGDEYEGMRAILEIFAALEPNDMSGDLLAVPVANTPAFWNGTRTNPLDRGDLARQFPGNLDGGVTAAIAYHMARTIIARADFLLDLHSAGVKLLMPTMVGYDSNDLRSQGAAMVFGTKVVWAHSQIPPGRTISFAKGRGIPWLYTEARGGGRIHAEDLRVIAEGIRNLMIHLSILPGSLSVTKVEYHLYGGGDLDTSMTSAMRGFFIPEVEILQKVSVGEELGRVVDLHGETLETFRAPRDGAVAMLRALPLVEPNEIVFFITGLTPESQE